jgi:dihydrofolate synthase/folylpolyglutamate synthase
MTNYEKALGYLKTAASRGSILGLERITELLKLLGEPQNKTRIIHVSGTNGKGSFGAMLTSVLKCAGYRTGGFSSPAITDVTDSFRINGTEITREKFAEIILDIASVCESMTEKPTEFEVLTAAAYELFAREDCDIVVVECGMGGDLDSTNAVSSPLLSVITNVQRDHCGFLGDTIEEIASHKAGIIKPGRPVFFGGDSEEALEVIRAAAERNSSQLYTADLSDFRIFPDSCTGLDGTVFFYKGTEIRIPLSGTYQLTNAVNVINCVEILRSQGVDIPDFALAEGLSKVSWHGRFEVLSRQPYVIYDGAHNPDGIREAADSIRRYFAGEKLVLLIGVMADKEYGLYSEMLGGLIDRVFAVTPDNPRSLDCISLAETFSAAGIPAEAHPVLADGVSAAYSYAKGKGVPLIALGSLYMYREFMEAFRLLK